MTSTDINELRDFISGELDKVHVRLDEVRKDQARLEALSARHFASIESRFGGVESRLGGVESRLTRVEILQEAMRSDFRVFGEDLRSTNRRLDDLREDMNQGFAE
jgi:archaellum component FlaC